MTAWGAQPDEPQSGKLPLLELFSPAFRRQTWLLFLLVALNFFAYQAFAGWTTTFLKDERGLGPEAIGWIVSTQFAGAADRRLLLGLVQRSVRAPSDRNRLRVRGAGGAGLSYGRAIDDRAGGGGFCWGFAITASVAWAPWIAELYPARVRSSAMSIFNWGRIISMTAPLVTGQIAASFGLEAAMLLGVLGFGLGAVVWFALPETVPSRKAQAAPKTV
jgi:hypothetical protein